jgi:hypothetical protein
VLFLDFVAELLALALMQFVPSEHHPPFPFIRLAKASDEMMGDGIDKIKAANTMAAAASKINFIANLPSETTMGLIQEIMTYVRLY